jgi:hypothetical protein
VEIDLTQPEEEIAEMEVSKKTVMNRQEAPKTVGNKH